MEPLVEKKILSFEPPGVLVEDARQLILIRRIDGDVGLNFFDYSVEF